MRFSVLGATPNISVQSSDSLPSCCQHPLPSSFAHHPQNTPVQVNIVLGVVLEVKTKVGYFAQSRAGVNENPDQGSVPAGFKIASLVALDQQCL